MIDDLEDLDEFEITDKKFKKKMFYYKIVTVLFFSGILIYFGITSYNTLSRNKFCSEQENGIHFHKGKFIFCKQGTSTILKDYHTYTKAICNTANYCMDVLLICNGEDLIDITPLGDGIQFGNNWKDNRDPDTRWGWCNE